MMDDAAPASMVLLIEALLALRNGILANDKAALRAALKRAMDLTVGVEQQRRNDSQWVLLCILEAIASDIPSYDMLIRMDCRDKGAENDVSENCSAQKNPQPLPS